MVRDGIPTTQALTEDVAAGLPGAPMAIPTPGHTGGHCSFVVDGVLVAGDALVTGHPLLTRSGPQLLPDLFNHDQDGCVRSLAALGLLDTDVLLPGHGPVWRGSIREAAEQATP
jgi:glyoxylase-like metal-dependent hydrolase (beta-lactamase superfamily II)